MNNKNLTKIMLIGIGSISFAFVILVIIAFSTAYKTPTSNVTDTASNPNLETNYTSEPASAYQFNPKSNTPDANQEYTTSFSVKPGANTVIQGYEININFDKSAIAVTSISTNVGVLSSGLSDSTSTVATINSKGTINALAEIQSASGQTLNAGVQTTLLTIKYKSLNNKTATIDLSGTKTSILFVVNTQNVITPFSIKNYGFKIG